MNPRMALRLCQRGFPPRCGSIPCRQFTAPPRRALDRDTFFSTSQARSRSLPSSSTASKSRITVVITGIGLLAFATVATAAFLPSVSLDALSLQPSPTTATSSSSDIHTADDDDANNGLPRFRLAEIRKHDGSSPRPWVIHGNKVYDITDWVPAHPGGDVILRAAGGSIDAYWDIFTIHKAPYVYEILSQYLIGHVHAADLTSDGVVADVIEDPFADDPARHPALITMTAKPRNAETPGHALDATFLTPNELFYVRNHMWVPRVDDPTTHTLTVELMDGTTTTYTLQELKARFPQRSVTAVLQCSGNRRSNMSLGSARKANGLPWDTGAISNATWEGVSLSDVLSDAGYKPPSASSLTHQAEEAEEEEEAKHVHFAGMEAYAASIPIRKALDPHGDVLLAWSMNGKPLPRDHGFPLRSVVPGHVAARSVKWLSKITLSDEESTSQWQRRDYKCFGPNEVEVDWDAAPAIQEMPVQSAITAVKLEGAVGKAGKEVGKDERGVSLGGYAYSGGGREIVRVDVSLDDGKTWSQATLLPDQTNTPPSSDHAAWAWKRWRYNGSIPSSAFKPTPFPAKDTPPSIESKQEEKEEEQTKTRECTNLVVKATDESYNTQPESHAATWNIRGNLATAWHKVQVCADCRDGQQKTTPPEN